MILTSANGGPIPSSLSGYSVRNGGNGIGTGSHFQKTVRQWYPPRQYWVAESLYHRAIILPTKLKLIERGLAFDVQDRMVSLRFLGSGWASRYVRVEVLSQRGWGHISYHKARAQGPYNSPLWFVLGPQERIKDDKRQRAFEKFKH